MEREGLAMRTIGRLYRRGACAALAACALFAGFVEGARAAEDAPATVERFVTFRDGTVLKLTLPDEALAFETLGAGEAREPGRRRLSACGDLRFAAQPRLDELAAFRQALRGLASEEFGTREAALQRLKKLAPNVRAEMLAAFQATDDPEVRARLGQLLRAQPADGAEPLTDTIGAEGEALAASLGDWKLSARSGETAIELTRARVASIRERAPEPEAGAAPAGPMARAAERLENDGDEHFGAERTRVDFETAPDGSALTPGMDVGRTFVAKGFTISTSIEGSIVSVNNYNVQGRSNGNSCATHQPLWEGSLTIRFCVPGRPEIPAGVTRAGLWIAAVMADGTALEAYDARGKRIAEIKTTRGPNEFLGVRSRVPIACLKVVPNPNIDPNYTIDDLVFDAPRPLDAFGHPDLLSVRFPNGERVLCQSARVKDGSLAMEGLGIGVERLARSFAPGTRVLTALKDQKAGDPPKGCWVRTADGSTLRAASEDGLACVRAPKLALSPANVCVLWSDAKGYFEFDSKQAPKGPGEGEAVKLSPAGTADGAALVFGLDKGKDGPLPFKAATFEKDLGLRGGDATVRVAYDQAPCVWLHAAKELPGEAARVNLVNGETLALRCPANPDAAFSFVSFGPEGAVVKQGTYEVRIALAEVASVVAP